MRTISSALSATLAAYVAISTCPLHAQTTTATTAAAFTIPQILSAPFPTDLVASPRGDAIAWVFDQAGPNNLWIARAPDWRARAITPYTADDGWEMSSPRWLPDGSGVVFVRGSAKNDRGEYPNPALDAKGRSQLVMLARVDGGAPRTLAEGAAAEPSPDGRMVAFTRGGVIYTIALDSGASGTHERRLFVGRGRDGNVRWSPDGSRIAFTSTRTDHSFVGVFNVRDSTLRYMAPSVDDDGYAVWAPDGRSLAFIRQPTRTRQPQHALRRAGQPWSILVADPATGTARELWRASRGPGSLFRRTDSRDELIWSTDDRIVFPWESGGWNRIYSISAGSIAGAPAPLTSGEREVVSVTPGIDGRSIVYVANEGNRVDLLHLWSVPASGGAPALLTPGNGIEWKPAAVQGGVALLHSGATTPARPAMLRLSGTASIIDLAPTMIPTDFPSSQLVTPQQVTFRSTDGLLLHGQLFLPANARDGKRHPAVVFYHGGSQRQMLLGFNPMGYYHNAYGLNQYLVSRGYVVLSVNYRSGIGYGLDFREALDYGPGGGAEARDAIAAAHYLRARSEVDPARIGVWGGSYGGYMTALSLARDPADYKVGVDFAGVHDWNLEWSRMEDTWDEDLEMKARRLAYASSPMSDLSHLTAPVLLIQGDDDRNVDFRQTVQLTEDLRNRGVHVETLIYPDETHEWLLHSHWIQSYEATAAFLERYLR
jgi:dipeptidyl aminopeptidase/acylaminoacyl peptidase